LEKASRAVEQARAEAEDGREEMEQEAATLLQDAKVAFESAEDQLTGLRKHSRKVAEARETFEATGKTLEEAEQAFDSGDFLSAHSKATDAKALIEQVLSDIG
jgi:hypothetical protein